MKKIFQINTPKIELIIEFYSFIKQKSWNARNLCDIVLHKHGNLKI